MKPGSPSHVTLLFLQAVVMCCCKLFQTCSRSDKEFQNNSGLDSKLLLGPSRHNPSDLLTTSTPSTHRNAAVQPEAARAVKARLRNFPMLLPNQTSDSRLPVPPAVCKRTRGAYKPGSTNPC